MEKVAWFSWKTEFSEAKEDKEKNMGRNFVWGISERKEEKVDKMWGEDDVMQTDG